MTCMEVRSKSNLDTQGFAATRQDSVKDLQIFSRTRCAFDTTAWCYGRDSEANGKWELVKLVKQTNISLCCLLDLAELMSS